MKVWFSRNRLSLAAFFVTLVVLGATAGSRLQKRSRDPHFIVQAHAWLKGRLHIQSWPRGADDPARFEEVELIDGSRVWGRRITTRGTFRIAGGKEVRQAQIKRTLSTTYHVAFPPFPTVLMLPQVALLGPHASDVITTILFAALVPAFFLAFLRRLREEGLSKRSTTEELWLAGLLTFGTVFYFSAIQGRVWYTAHVIGVNLCILYAWASIGAGRAVLAGTLLGLAFVTRAPMLFMFPFFALEVWRVRRKEFIRCCMAFAVPIVVIGLFAAWHNYARFGEFTEFGHSYLAVRQQAQIEKYGLFSLQYFPRNLMVAFMLLPEITRSSPYVLISGHGLAMWITTPAFVLLLWPRDRGPVHLALWITIACIAVWTFFYQNSGWFQFGYRFSLDYMVFLVTLLAIGGRPLTYWFRGLIILGIVVNLFGAITFNRYNQFYRADYGAYRNVVAK